MAFNGSGCSPLTQNRRFYSLFDCPSCAQPFIKSIARNSKFYSPFGNSKGHPPVFDYFIPSCIKHLLFSGGPSAIRRLIISAGVNSIKGHSRLWLAKVGKKIYKIMPPFAHFNASAAVVRIGWIFLIIASLFYAVPYTIERSFTHAVSSIGRVKLFRSFARFFISQTTARSNLKILKMVSSYLLNIPTLTLAKSITPCREDCKITNNGTDNQLVNFFSRHGKDNSAYFTNCKGELYAL